MKSLNLSLEGLFVSFSRFKVLYFLSALELVVIVGWSIYSGEGVSGPDTPSYYDAYDVLISGKPDAYRTPLYPIIIGTFRAIFGMTTSIALVYIFQSFLFLLSIGWFGKTLENVTHNRKIAFWFAAVYGLYPGVLAFCGRIMTESITVSLISALLYLVSEAYYHSSTKKALLSGMICILLLMQRPSLMSIPVLLAVMWLCIFFKKARLRKVAIRGFSASMISLIALGLYSIAFKMEYHKSGVTEISTWNNYLLIRKAHVYDPYAIESPEMRIDVDSIMRINGIDCVIGDSLWHEIGFLEGKHGIVEFDKFVNGQLSANSQKLLKYTCLDKLDRLIESNCVDTGDDLPAPMRILMRIMKISNGTAILIFLVGLTLLIISDIRSRRIGYFKWLIFAMFAANYFTVWIGAPGDYPRLLAQNYPVLIAIICWMISQLGRLGYTDESFDTTQKTIAEI